jgi:CheY-like chemotaxis protein
LEALSAERFDVLVTDYRMPGLSGLELARESRRIAPDLPVVLLSGNLDDRVLEESAAIGVARCLGKPCTPATLAAALAELDP